MCWSPSNLAGYLAPIAFVFITSILGLQLGFLLRMIVIVCFWVIKTFFYIIVNPDFVIPNSFFALFTWFGIIVLILYPKSNRVNYTLIYKKLLQPAWIILLIESLLGITQAIFGFIENKTFDLGTGDYVEGTIHPSLEPELSFANPIFSINIALLLLFLASDVLKRPSKRKIVIYLLGIISLILASTMHVIIFLIISLIISSTLVSLRIYKKINLSPIIVIIVTILTLTYISQPSNFQNISNVLQMRDTPRYVVIDILNKDITKMYWFSPIFGIGSGQFASRAGMISTGLYIGARWDEKPSELTTRSQRMFLLPLKQWQFFDPAFSNSSSTVPHYSWIAVYSEWGLMGLALITVYFISAIIKLLRKVTVAPIAIVSIMAAVILLFLLGWQEIYWEVPQAWFSSMLLVKILYFISTERRINLDTQ